MKIIRNLFILGLVNFVLIVGVLMAADFVKQNRQEQKPIPVAPDQVIPIENPISGSPLTITKSPTPAANKAITGTPKVTAAPTAQSTPKPTPTTDPLAGKCIIYISGQRYDMTDFRNIHSGGDIFQCGTDMTAIFNDRHPSSYLDRIAKYKI